MLQVGIAQSLQSIRNDQECDILQESRSFRTIVPIQFLFLTDDYKLHASIALYFADPQSVLSPFGIDYLSIKNEVEVVCFREVMRGVLTLLLALLASVRTSEVTTLR